MAGKTVAVCLFQEQYFRSQYFECLEKFGVLVHRSAPLFTRSCSICFLFLKHKKVFEIGGNFMMILGLQQQWSSISMIRFFYFGKVKENFRNSVPSGLNFGVIIWSNVQVSWLQVIPFLIGQIIFQNLHVCGSQYTHYVQMSECVLFHRCWYICLHKLVCVLLCVSLCPMM